MNRAGEGERPAQCSRSEKGVRGESLARLYLEGMGYRILAARWRCRQGEIDLIAKDQETTVFVEVRMRSREDHGLPQESVGALKQRRLFRLAARWLAVNPSGCSGPCRFDVVAITSSGAEGPRRIVHLKDAFRS